MKPDKKSSNSEKQLTGKVVLQKFGAGSKSEHNAICLQTSEGTYKLKRMGGNPFNDPELNKLVGKQIKATGMLDQYQFIAKDLQETGK